MKRILIILLLIGMLLLLNAGMALGSNATSIKANFNVTAAVVENVSVNLPSFSSGTTNSSQVNTTIGNAVLVVVTNGTTIPVTLNVTVSVAPPSTATDISSEFAGAIPNLYFNISVNNSAWFSNISHVQFKAFYNESNIPSNVAESTLRAHRFATTWQRLDCAELGGCNATLNDSAILYASEVDTTGNFVFANLSRFSTFALAGTVSAAAAAGGAVSGAGTGGAGVTTSEPFDNIAKAERYDKNLIANVPVIYSYKALELGIYEIALTGKESENAIALRVEALKGTSKLVTASPPGTVYKNVNVWAGTRRIKEVLIRFKVENSWLTDNSVASSDVKMVKWDGSKWVLLETSEISKDETFTFYEAKTDTLSVFAITGLKGVAVPTATPAIGVTETPAVTGTTPAPVPTEKVPGFEVLAGIAALHTIYLFSRKRR